MTTQTQTTLRFQPIAGIYQINIETDGELPRRLYEGPITRKLIEDMVVKHHLLMDADTILEKLARNQIFNVEVGQT